MVRTQTYDLGTRNTLDRRTSRSSELKRSPIQLEILESRCAACAILPEALDDLYIAEAELLLDVPVEQGLLANDTLGMQGSSTPCGTVLSAVLVEGPDEGSLSLNSNGSFTFIKDTEGGVSFTYKVCDALGYCSPTATVSISVVKKPAEVKFVQERGAIQTGAGGWDEWTQPAGMGDGGLYGSGTIAAVTDPNTAKIYSWASNWQTPPAWATSWVEASWPGGTPGICNSNNNPQSGTTPAGTWIGQSGTLTAWLRGTPGSKYTVELAVTVDLSKFIAPGGGTGIGVQANLIDYTLSSSPPPAAPAVGNHTELVTMTDVGSGPYYDSWTGEVTAALNDQWNAAHTVVTVPKGQAKIVAIVPTLAGTGIGTSDFWGTIEIVSVT